MQSEGVARCVTMHAGCIVQPLRVDFVIPMPELRFDSGVPDVHAIVSDAISHDFTYFNKTYYAATCPKTCSGASISTFRNNTFHAACIITVWRSGGVKLHLRTVGVLFTHAGKMHAPALRGNGVRLK